jgi:hypothetical protein
MFERPLSRRLRRPLLAALVLVLPAAPVAADEGHADLLGLMNALQTLLHKTQLSLLAGNLPLAAFYAHELEESAEVLAEVGEYDGHRIGELSHAMLMPAVDALDEALNGGDLPGVEVRADDGLERVIHSCNACHAATEHAFIVIGRNELNPYAQRFEVR